MFQKGNKFGKGRPKISLNKPELLLPIIFQKSNINWAEDFSRLYKANKMRKLNPEEKETYTTLMALLPYLCTKVAVKDLDFSKWHGPEDAKIMSDQTAALIKALENEPKSTGSGGQSSMEGGSSSVSASS